MISFPLLIQDLLRTMPSNACFCNINSTGIPRLRRILRGLAWLYPDVGYCQGTGMVIFFFHCFKERTPFSFEMVTVEYFFMI